MNPMARGRLLNGNPASDLRRLSLCGAKTRRGTVCQHTAMANHRCRFHGGKSTGPRTPEGLARSRKARLVHGRFSAEARAERARYRAVLWIRGGYEEWRKKPDRVMNGELREFFVENEGRPLLKRLVGEVR
jgi:hypothetical protein